MRFMQDISIRMIEFDACRQAIGVQELRETIEQRAIHFGCAKMYLVSHISESIRQMGSGEILTTNITQRLCIGNAKEAHRSTNKVHYIQQMLKHNDRCTILDYTEQTLSCLALQGWCNIDSAKVCYLPSAAEEQLNTRRAHRLRLHHCLEEAFSHRISQLVHHLTDTCPWHVQKYQINNTQRCISTFQNSEHWTAIPYTN